MRSCCVVLCCVFSSAAQQYRSHFESHSFFFLLKCNRTSMKTTFLTILLVIFVIFGPFNHTQPYRLSEFRWPFFGWIGARAFPFRWNVDIVAIIPRIDHSRHPKSLLKWMPLNSEFIYYYYINCKSRFTRVIVSFAQRKHTRLCAQRFGSFACMTKFVSMKPICDGVNYEKLLWNGKKKQNKNEKNCLRSLKATRRSGDTVTIRSRFECFPRRHNENAQDSRLHLFGLMKFFGFRDFAIRSLPAISRFV